jgi:hypothetical protein
MTDFVSGLFLSLPDHGLAMIENKIHGGGALLNKSKFG